MKNLKQIFVTLVVVAFTILNIYKLEMPVPKPTKDDIEYSEYANTYLMLTGICFILISCAYMTGEKNKFIESSLIVNIGAYATLVLKTIIKSAEDHCYYDWTFIGIAIIAAVIHLLPTKHYKKNE